MHELPEHIKKIINQANQSDDAQHVKQMAARSPFNKSMDQIMDEWMLAAKTLFPKFTPGQCLKKATIEMIELCEVEHPCSGVSETEQLQECADVFMCIISYCAAKGFTVNQLKHAIAEKTVRNLNREWIEQPDGTYQHKNPDE